MRQQTVRGEIKPNHYRYDSGKIDKESLGKNRIKFAQCQQLSDILYL